MGEFAVKRRVFALGFAPGALAAAALAVLAVLASTLSVAAAQSPPATGILLRANPSAVSESSDTTTITGTGASLTATPGTLTINDDNKPPALDATGCTNGTHATNTGLVADCQHLSQLRLHNNRLTGEIPAQLGSLSSLTSFSFCGNYLAGALPAALRAGVTLDFTPGDYDMIGTCRRPAPVFGGLFLEPSPLRSDAFDDDSGSGHEAAINALAKAGVTRGCAPRRFCPAQPATRSQAAVLIYRSVARQTGVGAPYAGRVALTDVPADAAWWNAAQWAASTGVVPATPDGRFNPAGIVNRADGAIMLAAAFEHLGLTKIDLTAEPQHLFTDTQGHLNTTVNAVEALYWHRFTHGCSADPLRYCPDQPMTRAQLATMLSRTLGLTPALG